MKVNKLTGKSLNLEDFIFILLVCLFCFVFNNVLLKSLDIGCIISSGSFIIDNLSVYLPDNTLFTEVNPFWVNSNWLSDVIFTIVYKIGNYKLLLAFSSILVSILFAIILRQMMLKFNNWPINLTLLFVGILACWDFIEISSKLFSYLFILAYFYFLNSIVEKGFSKKYLVCLLIITLFWANIRSDFLIGILIIVIYSVSFYLDYIFSRDNKNKTFAKNFLLITFLCLLFSLINPYGFNEIIMVLKYYGQGLNQYNGFLASPDFHIKLPFFFFELFILLLVFLAVFSNYKVPLYKLLSLGFLLLFSLYSAVNIVFFIIVSLPIISEVINNSDEFKKIPYYKDFLNFSKLKITNFSTYPILISAVLVTFIVLIFPDIDKRLTKIKNMPVKTVAFLNNNKIQGKMFNPLGWGCYLSNELNCKAFINERMYKINKQTLLDYNRVVNVYSNYPEILERNGIKWIIIPDYFVLNQLLEESKRWKLMYKDNSSSVFVYNNHNDEE